MIYVALHSPVWLDQDPVDRVDSDTSFFEKQIFYPLIASEMKQINPLSSPLILPVKRFRIEIGEDFSPSALKKLIVTLEQL